MSMLKMSILPIALLATLPAAAVYSVADGTDGELPVVISVKGGSGVASDGLGHLSPDVWGDGEIPHNTADYVIMSNKTEYALGGASSFEGHSLQIGTTDYSLKSSGAVGALYMYNRSDSAAVANVAEFQNEGLILVNGNIRTRYYNNTDIAGKVTVLAPASRPFRLYCGRGDRSGYTGFLRFHGAFHGTSTAGLIFTANEKLPWSGLKICGDWSQYFGSLVITGMVATAADAWPGYGVDRKVGDLVATELQVTNTVLAGTVIMHEGTRLMSYSSGEPFVVSNLVLKAGSTLKLSGNVTVGSLTMEGGATIDVLPQENGTVIPVLTVLDSVAISDGAVNVTIDGYAATSGVNSAVLVMPAGASVTADDFVFTGWAATLDELKFSPRSVRVEPDAETGAVNVVPYYPPIISLLSNDSTTRVSEHPSAITNALQWSDGREPHGDAHYYLGNHSLRIYDTLPCSQYNAPTLEYVFPGLSLLFGQGSSVTFICKSVTVTNAIVYGTGCGINTPAYTQPTWYGPLEILAGANMTFNIGYGKQLTWNGEVSGAGNLTLRGLSGGATSSPSGYVSFTEPNTNFSGRVTVTIPIGGSGKNTTPSFGSKFFTLYLSEGHGIGGAMSPADTKGIVLQNMCRIAVAPNNAVSAVLDEPTRGIFVEWVGRFLANAGQTLTINSPLAVHGTMYKEGEGLLALGSAVKFGVEGTLDQWEEGEDATNHAFMVTGGDVRILNADALNGLNVIVSNTASAFRLPFSSGDADLKAYGIRNVKTDAPFAVAVDGAKLNIRLDPPEELPQPQDTFGLVTVPLDQTNAVAQLLEVHKPEAGFDGFGLKFSLVANEDGETATFKATVKTHGTLLTIR